MYKRKKKIKIPILFLKKENCCGCTACYAICPNEAISMIEDDEGFVYPNINEEMCIGCNKCLSVCIFKYDQILKGFLDEMEGLEDG